MATRFMYKALSTAALGIALSLLLAAPTTASPAWSNTAGALQLDPPAAPSNCRSNPFAGIWSGPGTVDNEPVGTLHLTISDAGRLTGRVYHLQDDQSGELVGHVRADGYVMLINFVPSDNPSVHGNGTPLQGSFVIDGDGTLFALLTARFSGGDSIVAILERN